MIYSAFAPLAALAVLQVKHLICDFFLQSSNQIENKGTYGHPGGLIHAGIHAIGSLAVFLIYPVPILTAIVILIAEFLAHYHIDWLKNVIGRHYGWTPRDKQYWWAMGADQFLHQITYLIMVAVLMIISP
ncbi:DUF3307 domain-containing protein [Kaistia dalseonensis]|uniref:DUF3307 domain-containing protein n=1 Tax=Kaistia dalseonensis TaxID=410840 RepID=A0ABU0HCZ8_9HYPH|nr:DUF3307 domain-containing protein [Kaistia dalseonensis]MCX5497558.1 DUF3307 domain-containing protein [Kaistia dalseonensis]MDQ0440198.1 hypothetical protein [Kaistia dalseonensis]